MNGNFYAIPTLKTGHQAQMVVCCTLREGMKIAVEGKAEKR